MGHRWTRFEQPIASNCNIMGRPRSSPPFITIFPATTIQQFNHLDYPIVTPNYSKASDSFLKQNQDTCDVWLVRDDMVKHTNSVGVTRHQLNFFGKGSRHSFLHFPLCTKHLRLFSDPSPRPAVHPTNPVQFDHHRGSIRLLAFQDPPAGVDRPIPLFGAAGLVRNRHVEPTSGQQGLRVQVRRSEVLPIFKAGRHSEVVAGAGSFGSRHDCQNLRGDLRGGSDNRTKRHDNGTRPLLEGRTLAVSAPNSPKIASIRGPV